MMGQTMEYGNKTSFKKENKKNKVKMVKTFMKFITSIMKAKVKKRSKIPLMLV